MVGVGSNVGTGVAGSGVYAVGELTGDCVNDGSLSTLYEQPASPQKVNTAKNSAKSFFFIFYTSNKFQLFIFSPPNISIFMIHYKKSDCFRRQKRMAEFLLIFKY